MNKKTLVAELYCHDEPNEESIYAVYEVKNGKKKFLGGLHFFDYDVIESYDISENEFDECAKDIALDYAEDGSELMTEADIKDWILGTGCYCD